MQKDQSCYTNSINMEWSKTVQLRGALRKEKSTELFGNYGLANSGNAGKKMAF